MHFVIFGGTGDLSQRKLLPSLFHMFCDGLLLPDFKIHIVARGDYTDATCRDLAQDALVEFADALMMADAAKVSAFIEHIHYQKLDVYDELQWQAFSNKLNQVQAAYAFYMAVPPSAFAPISQALKQHGFADHENLLVVEKPLGEDLQTADEINQILIASFDEDHIYRIDHYLGKEAVKTWTDLRLAHSEMASCWSDAYIDRIDVTIMETVGVEGRFEYLDKLGVLRDMVQNHMLQLLALTMMDISRVEPDALRQAKADILKNLSPCVPENMVRGQYATGTIQGETVPAYLKEIAGHADGVGDTYVALRSFVDTDQWRNTDIYIRMGKRLAKRQADIVIHFTQKFIEKFDLELPYLQINIQPDMVMSPIENAMNLFEKTDLADRDAHRHIEAYEALLRDLLNRNKTFFVHGDENKAAWAWVDDIRAKWDKNQTIFAPYEAGSYGPVAANQILKAGHKWQEDI